MSAVVPFPPSSESPSVASDDPRDAKIFDAIKLLLGTLSLNEQRRVLLELTQEAQPIAAPRAGEVLGKIVRWIPRDSPWTVEEAKRGIAVQGVSASPKAIYNAIAYLTRKGHVRRIGYGRYVINGVALTTAHDLGLEPSRDEDD